MKADNASDAVENLFHDPILTAIHNIVEPKLKIIIRLITASSGGGSVNMTQNSVK